jgi:hypothetical protein
LAGERTPGKPSGEVRWHGSPQAGKIKLTGRQVNVKVRACGTNRKGK